MRIHFHMLWHHGDICRCCVPTGAITVILKDIAILLNNSILYIFISF